MTHDRIGFAGTPEFGLTVLQALANTNYGIPLVITRPDRPVGRSRDPQPTPVRKWAVKHGLKVETPKTAEELYAVLKKANLDLLVVAAYGMILRKKALQAPKRGCVNVHASLLPDYRGASPIQQAILDGRTETGVTIMKMDEGLDTGPILDRKKVPIAPDDDYLTLSAKLAVEGGKLLVKVIPDFLSGMKPENQGEPTTLLTKPLKRTDGVINWEQPAEKILLHIRARRGWPGANRRFGEQRIEILEAEESNGPPLQPDVAVEEKGNLFVGTGSGIPLLITRLQPPGKNPMDASDWLRGYRGNLNGQSASDSD